MIVHVLLPTDEPLLNSFKTPGWIPSGPSD